MPGLAATVHLSACALTHVLRVLRLVWPIETNAPCATPLSGSSSIGDTKAQEATPHQAAQHEKAVSAVLRASASASGPRNGIVAVKVFLAVLHKALSQTWQLVQRIVGDAALAHKGLRVDMFTTLGKQAP